MGNHSSQRWCDGEQPVVKVAGCRYPVGEPVITLLKVQMNTDLSLILAQSIKRGRLDGSAKTLSQQDFCFFGYTRINNGRPEEEALEQRVVLDDRPAGCEDKKGRRY